MKQGWEIKKLKEGCRFVGGYTPSPSLLHAEGHIPYFKVSDMNRDGNSRELYNTELYLKEAKKTYPAGAIVFPKNGGAVLTNKKRILVTNSVVDLNTGVAIPNSDVNVDYLYYFFCGVDFCNFVKEGTLPVLKIKEIGELPIFLPHLAEQERIVEILDKEFERIDALKANAEQNMQHAKDLFQAALKQELQPKEGWNKYLLSDICEYRKEQGKHTNLPYVGMENIETGTGKLLGNQKGEDILSSTFRFQRGYVMYGRLRPYLKKVFVSDFEGCCSTEIFPIVTNGILPHLLKFWFLEDSITDKINQTCGGCRMPRANMNQVMQFDIWLPKLDVQTEIVARLEKLNTNCSALEENYKKTIALCDDMKQALLRKAFNGEL